jgi:hypothetical protein
VAIVAFGFWLLAFGFWLLAFGFWLLRQSNLILHSLNQKSKVSSAVPLRGFRGEG